MTSETIWHEQELDEELEGEEVESIFDWDEYSDIGLENEVEKRSRLLDQDNELQNPVDSVHSLDELNSSMTHRVRDSVANLLQPEERSIGNAVTNAGAFIGGLGTSGIIQETAYEVANIEPWGSIPEFAAAVPITAASLGTGFGAVLYAGLKYNEFRGRLSDDIRPTPLHGKPFIGEDIEEAVDELMQESEVVETEEIGGTEYELSNSVDGVWSYRYLASREDEPNLHHISWHYDEKEEELEWEVDFIIDWQEHSPVDVGPDYLGAVDAWRFRGVIDDEKPEIMREIGNNYDAEEQKKMVEDRYGHKVRDLYEEKGFFEKEIEKDEEWITGPLVHKMGEYPTSSN